MRASRGSIQSVPKTQGLSPRGFYAVGILTVKTFFGHFVRKLHYHLAIPQPPTVVLTEIKSEGPRCRSHER